jgi:DNA-binding protein H-NS
MTLSKYDSDFSDAMALKLRLNREARQTEDSVEAKQSKEHETVIVQTKAPYDRSEEIRNLVAKHPGLTPEAAEQGLRELGF